MPSGLNLYRRSAVYYFRRRLPTATGNGPVTLHVSLHTKDRAKAKALAAELTHVSDTLFDEARRGHLTSDEIQRILVAVARRQAKKLELLAVVDRANPVADPMSGERADRINGAVYRLLAERGRAAALPQDPAFLRGCGLDPGEAEQVRMSLEFYRSQKLIPANPEKLRLLLSELAPNVSQTALALADAEHAYYRGMAAALLQTSPRWGSTVEQDIALAFGTGPADQPVIAQPVANDKAPSAAHVAVAVAGTDPVAEPGTKISVLTDKYCAKKVKLKEWTAKTARQMQKTADLLIKIIGHDDILLFTQSDAANFVDKLLMLPKNYGKSCHDDDKTIDALIAHAKEMDASKVGLDGVTINRHLTHLQGLLKFATGQGTRTGEPVNLTLLRTKKVKRDRDERAPFTEDDLKAIFASPVWRGCHSERDRLATGSVIIHDSLYWVPLIATYSLMRREEICGLAIEDVKLDGPIAYFDVRENEYRRLKTASSKRKIPIHSELARLGLGDYIQAIKGLDYPLLFPELISANGKAPLGDQFYEDFAPVLDRAVPLAALEKKVFHSTRHFGNDAMVDGSVLTEWRADIMGHGGRGETEERYRDEVRLQRKLAALGNIPIVTEGLRVAPITLRQSVMKKLRRRPRSRLVSTTKTVN